MYLWGVSHTCNEFLFLQLLSSHGFGAQVQRELKKTHRPLPTVSETPEIEHALSHSVYPAIYAFGVNTSQWKPQEEFQGSRLDFNFNSKRNYHLTFSQFRDNIRVKMFFALPSLDKFM